MSLSSIFWTHPIARLRQNQKRRRSVLRHILQQAKPCWPQLAGIVFLSLLSAPLSLLLPLPLKIAVDSVLGSKPAPAWLNWAGPDASRTSTLLLAAGLLLGVAILMHLQALASWILQTYTGEKLVLNFRARLFWHAQRLSLSFHHRRGSSDTAYRIQHDAPAIQYVTIQGAVPFLNSMATFCGMMYVTSRIDHQLAMLAVGLSPVLFLLARSSSARVHQRWHAIKELDSSAMSVLEEVLSSVRLVKAFGREQREDERFHQRSSKRMWGQVRLAWLQAGFHTAIGLVIAIGAASTLFIGVLHVREGKLTIGALLLVMSYMSQLYEPLRTMSSKIPELQAWMVSLERAFAIFDEAPEPFDAPHARRLHRARGELRFENVSFAYGKDEPVLRHVSFDVPAGSRVGIVGRTGSGKSTLVGLMTRFYDVSAGRILLDGVDLREYRLEDVRRQFAVVPQEPVLFSTSVAENIAFTRPEASQEEIEAAAIAADAHQFIEMLPSGYQTQVGDRGTRLSGGQRQRIAVARAMLKDAPILVLDEPTSAVDRQTEAEMMLSSEALISGRTTLMIAHRLSTLSSCDFLLEVAGGKVHVRPNSLRQESWIQTLSPEETGTLMA